MRWGGGVNIRKIKKGNWMVASLWGKYDKLFCQ